MILKRMSATFQFSLSKMWMLACFKVNLTKRELTLFIFFSNVKNLSKTKFSKFEKGTFKFSLNQHMCQISGEDTSPFTNKQIKTHSQAHTQ